MIERRVLSRVDAETCVALGELYSDLGQQLMIRAKHISEDHAERDRVRERRRQADRIGDLLESLIRAGARPRQAVAQARNQFPNWTMKEVAALLQLRRWRRRGDLDPPPRATPIPDDMPRLFEHPAFKAAQRNQERARRDLQIVRMARRGLSNKEIGAKVGLRPETVSRIITKQLDRGRRRVDRPRVEESR